MKLVAMLRLLWRRRILVAVGALAALAVGLMTPRETSHVGIAAARVMLDTPDSELVYSAPVGAASLTWRTQLVGNLMATDAARASIARDAGVPATRLVVVNSALEKPTVQTPLPDRAAEAAATKPEAYSLAVRLDETLPIVSIDALAPDRSGAARLVGAAIHELRVAAAPPHAAPTQRSVVETVTPTRTRKVARGSGPAKAIGASIAVFGLWWACVLIASWMLGAGRRTEARMRSA